MDTISGIKAFIIFGVLIFAAVTEGRPGTNFAGSSISSDSSGTRSSHIIGSVPDSSPSNPNPIPNTRIYSIPNAGGGGATVLTTRNGGTAVLTSNNNGGGVGVVSSSGPSRTQYSPLVPSNPSQPQPSVLGRFGSPQSPSGGSGAGTYAYPSGAGVGTGAYSSPYGGGASSGAFAGPSGASAGAYAGGHNFDYYSG